MKLHRITLRNFRGVTASTVEFADRGVTVVSGPNEVGKSSLAEALRLVRDFKDSSRHRAVLAVQPLGVDAGPEVEIELSTGPYRLVYAKRWIKAQSTTLTVSAPRPEQHSGDPAHERAEAIFAETIDPALWSALQQVQGQGLDQAELAGSVPLQQALGALEATDVDTLAGENDDLRARVRAEYERYWTRTGKPVASVVASATAVTKAEATLAEAASALDDLDRRIEQQAATIRRLDKRRGDQAAARREVDALSQRDLDLRDVAAAVETAAAAVENAHRTVSDTDRAWASRQEAINDATTARAELAKVEQTRTRIESDVEIARSRVSDAERELTQARTDRDAASTEAAALREAATAAAARADYEAVAAKLDQIATIETALAKVEAELAALADMDDSDLARLRELGTAVAVARAQAADAAPRVEIDPLGPGEIRVDGRPLEDQTLDDGGALAATEPLVVEVPGRVRVTITPPTTSHSRAEQAQRAERDLAVALERLGVASADEAALVVDQRRDGRSAAADLRRQRAALLGDDTIESLRAHGDRLARDVGSVGADLAAPEPAALAAAEQRASAAEQRLRAAERLLDEAREQADPLIDQARRLTADTEALAADVRRLDERLSRYRAEVDDDALQGARERATAEAAAAEAALAAARAALAAAGGDTLADDLNAAEQRLASISDELTGLEVEFTSQQALIDDRLRLGWHERHAEAQAHLDLLAAEHARLRARAAAADLLETTVARHQAAAQARYVEPFRREIARLGRAVFGEDLDVTIGADLQIVDRTLSGVTVPFAALSGGAKEQLVMIGRLAAAGLVDEEAGAPVILDDALGFSDAERRRAMAAVLREAGRAAQIIVLTCEPDRYDDLSPARRVSL